MAGTTIKVEGTEQAIKDIKATELRKRGQVAKAVALTAINGHRSMVQMLSHPGRGRTYTHFYLTNRATGGIFPGKERSKPHTASKPGDPPAVDFGHYRSSWYPKVDAGGMGGEVATRDHRSNWLEYGTKRMAARPHAGPVSEIMKGDFVRNMKAELSE